MSKATEDQLDALHGELAAQLASKIRSGEATAADMAVARQFLKDNGIQSLPTPKSPLGELADSLPFADPDDILRDRSTFN
jgi:hypothetical protein